MFSIVDAGREVWRRPGVWLVVVAVAHAAAPLVLLGAHWALGIDETVYLSQLNHSVPAQWFSAPRSRGSTLITAPVTLLTSSLAAVRVWVTLLSGLGLWLAFRPWLRLVRGWVVPVAAAGFASLWVVTIYGFEVMPNEWVAFATLGGCGALLRWFREKRARHLVVVAVALAIIGLLRPSDAGYAAAGLALAALVVAGPWRDRDAWRSRGAAVGALAVGTIIGVAEWIAEAEVRFGGISERIHLAQAEQGGSGPYFSVGAQARVLAGPLLCRGSCHVDAPQRDRLWWWVVAALVLVAVVAVVRQRHDRDVVLVPTVVAVVTAAQYLVTVGYGAPRFLLPTYVLVAIPAVIGARTLVVSVRSTGPRRVLAGALALLLVAGAVQQVHLLRSKVAPPLRLFAATVTRQVSALRAAGVRDRHCVATGATSTSLPVSYALACRNGPHTHDYLRRAADAGVSVVWLAHSTPSSAISRRWQRVQLPGSRYPAWVSRPTGRSAVRASTGSA